MNDPAQAPINAAGNVTETPAQPRAEVSADRVTEVRLASTSRSADAGHLAAADIVAIAHDADIEFRLVGGNAISLLVWAHGVADFVPERETNDADLGVPAEAAGAAGLIEAMVQNGYRQVDGNRFSRSVDHDGAPLPLEIDVLIPAFGPRMESNQPFGDLVVDAIPGLGVAIARDPIRVRVTTTLTTDVELIYTVPLPDSVSALCMKAYAYRWRFAQRDALDIWRLLEVIRSQGLTKDDWPKGVSGRETAQILHTYFAKPASTGPAAATEDRAKQARVRALVLAQVPPPST